MRIKVSIVIEVEDRVDLITGIRTVKKEIQKQLDNDQVHDWVVEVLDN